MSDHENESTEYSPLVAFTDDSQNFTNGFEAGMVWRDLDRGLDELEGTYRAENKEVLKRIADYYGYGVKFEGASYDGVVYDEWVFAQFIKQRNTEKPKPDLQVIDGGLTRHGDKRLRKRNGLKRKAVAKQVEAAKTKGLPRLKAKGQLRTFLNGKFRVHTRTDFTVYQDNIFVFALDDGALVTTYHLPKSLVSSARKQIARLSKDRDGEA